MGTNYYIDEKRLHSLECDEDGAGRVHIGKNSFGWVFCFQSQTAIFDPYRETGKSRPTAHPLRSLRDFKFVLDHWLPRAGGRIVDEYGKPCSTEAFWVMVESTRHRKSQASESDCYVDDGFDFYTREFS